MFFQLHILLLKIDYMQKLLNIKRYFSYVKYIFKKYILKIKNYIACRNKKFIQTTRLQKKKALEVFIHLNEFIRFD